MFSPSRESTTDEHRCLMGALRMQAVWAGKQAERIAAAKRTSRDLASLWTALYHKTSARRSGSANEDSADESLAAMHAQLAVLEQRVASLPSREQLEECVLGRAVANALAAQQSQASPRPRPVVASAGSPSPSAPELR